MFVSQLRQQLKNFPREEPHALASIGVQVSRKIALVQATQALLGKYRRQLCRVVYYG